MSVQPTYFIPHGGGPCFFMDDPRGVWSGMEAFLRSLPPSRLSASTAGVASSPTSRSIRPCDMVACRTA